MTPSACRGGLGLLAFLLLGCAGAARPPAVAPAAAQEPRRSLFQVSYRGPEGSGSLRLALLVAGRSRYQARASDRFGRGLWSLELAQAEARFLDHRRRLFCVGGTELRIPELALGSLSLERLPDVLASRLPATPARTRHDPADFVDREGRRWTAGRSDAGELVAWTLWSGDRPLLWWQRQPGGGILSHRGGAQLRWRRTVEEPLKPPLPEVPVPRDYQETDCETLTAAVSRGEVGRARR